MQRESADTEGGQLHGVQQGDLDHPVRLGAAARPVLVTLYLQGLWIRVNMVLINAINLDSSNKFASQTAS